MWSSKYVDCEKSAKGSRAHLKQKGAQLQPNDAAFSVVNFQGRGQPPLQWTNATFSVGCPTHEARRGCEQRETKAAKGSSAYMEQMSPKLQQKNALFSAGMKPQGQPKEAAISVGSNKEQKKGVSQLDKGTSSGFDEECKEFVRMFREKLQEFAMILSKKYHYNFSVEYFDDYHGSFNKEEFLEMEQQEEKLKETANKEARSIDHFMEEWERESEVKERRNQKQNCYEDGLLVAEISSNVVKVEGLDNVEGFLSNDKKENAPAEGRLVDPKQCHHIAANFGDDIGDELHPSKGTCNEQIDKATNAEGSFDIAEKEVQIKGNCSQQKGKDVADWEEKNVESLAGKNKSHSIMFVVTTAGRLEFLSPLLKGGMKTEIDETAQQVVSGAMQGIDGIMFAYGATSSGKTHTMHGEQKSPEILPLAVKDSFKISPAKLWKKRKKEAYWKLRKFGMSWRQDMFQGGEIVMSLE